MSNLQQSDLILAGRYVDGDLSAHQVAAVESRIESDADFSAAVEKIRDQSSALNLLPKFQPSEDLADRTLQASMDQVRAIMGAWPLEDADSKPSPKSELPLSNSDWKSTIALIASLAGVVMLGLILWQNNNNIGDGSSVAVNQPGLATDSEVTGGELEKSFAGSKKRASDPAFESLTKILTSEQNESADVPLAQKSDSSNAASRQQLAVRSESNGIGGGGFGGGGGGLLGTPAKLPPSSIALDSRNPSNVAQIWCVNPDQSVPKNSVCEILQSNQIQVQLEAKNQLTSNAFDAYYVAATPRQMKKVLTEISNEANIEMFPLPQGSDSLIADAIQQQYQQSGEAAEQQITPQKSLDPNAPKRLVLPTTNALAQQLELNSVPRAQPPLDPPEILQAESLNEDLAPRNPKIAMKRSKNAQPKVNSTIGKGTGSPSQAAVPAGNPLSQQATLATRSTATKTAIPDSHGKIDKLLDESDQRLQQYLILVHADEKTSR